MGEPTQGKWTRDGQTVRVDGKGIVAHCPLPRDGGCFECADNAKLIAKAWLLPELVDALRSMMRGNMPPDLGGTVWNRVITPSDEACSDADRVLALYDEQDND